jgi:hypothetical protein
MFESLRKFWNETMEITEARWVVWLTLLLVLVVTAVYLVKLFRDFAFGTWPSEADRINEMRNLKEIGALNDAEFRRARAAMSTDKALADKPRAGELGGDTHTGDEANCSVDPNGSQPVR